MAREPVAERGDGRACGKAILVGEHFVVYGGPAIAVPVRDAAIEVAIGRAGGGIGGRTAPESGVDAHVQACLEVAARRFAGPAPSGVEVAIRSSIPVGAGLGSSAALSVAMARAFAAWVGVEADEETLREVSIECERIAHGNPSGIDTEVTLRERPVRFVRGEAPRSINVAPNVGLVAIDTGTRASTAAMVGEVAVRRAADPASFSRWAERGAAIAGEAETALAGGDVAALGRALDANAALLTAIGVSTGELERAVLAARRAGAAGAKPTGSGGGGIVIGVCEATEAAAIADRLRERGFRIVAAGPIVPADPSGIPARTGDAKMDVKERLAAARRDHWGAVRGLLDAVIDDTTPAGSSLGEMCRYHLDTGGKRLRALIPILAAETLGLPPEKARPFGAACEMLHNATLVHDDLQDGDAVRRGRDTVWKKWSAAQAINLGDAMFHWAAALLQRIDAPAETLSELLDLFVRGTIRVIDGQAREFLLKERNAPTAEDYFAVVEGKTSGLFEIPIVGAAILARSPAPLRRALAAAAGDLGVLFQVHDDLIDLYGEKGRARRGGDIAEGKISALVVHALAHAPSAESAWLRATLSKPREETTVEDIDRADRLFREHGSVRFAKEEMARRHRRAVEYPELSGIPALRGLIDGLATLMGSDTII